MYSIPANQTRFETIGSYKYIGVAPSGSLTSDSVWKIVRLTLSGSDISEVKWAEGTESSIFKWDDKSILNYL